MLSESELKAAVRELHSIIEDAIEILEPGPTKKGEKQNEQKPSHNQNIRRREPS